MQNTRQNLVAHSSRICTWYDQIISVYDEISKFIINADNLILILISISINFFKFIQKVMIVQKSASSSSETVDCVIINNQFWQNCQIDTAGPLSSVHVLPSKCLRCI
ncbi:hypothetical protein BpHYR1_009601 [Brachionus plicatilis]|uniref:Uncharacterized protein n=1 Tax=Brachionus plicatilis TaxID=10195 RepID=A0A3M7T5R4_BRAPC|nr:hypothetical protein BpHYR1_009601 [Brachionus plicatilis]